MKRNVFLSIAYLMICFGFMSCSVLAENKEPQAYLRFGYPLRTVQPSVDLSKLTDFELSGEMKENSKTLLRRTFSTTSDLLNSSVIIEPGTWDFTLTAKKSTIELRGLLRNQVIAEGENILTFELEIQNLGAMGDFGKISITLNFPECGTVKGVLAGLFNIEDDTEIEGFGLDGIRLKNNSVTYSANSVPIGNYRFKAFLYGDNAYIASINTYREIVSVASECTSSAVRTLSDLNDTYTITYDMGGGTFSNAYIAPEIYSRNSEFLLSTAENIEKTGYAFVGWYESEDFSTARVTEIKKTTGNKHLYARWATGKVVTENNLSSIDLSAISDGYTLAVVGNVDLSVLATKIKAATGIVNLDLFASKATKLEDNLFADCSKIASVVLPEELREIGSQAFLNCTSLSAFALTDSVTEIAENPFGGCTSLSSIEVPLANAEYISKDGVLFSKNGDTLIQYPAGKTDASYSIPDGTVIVGDNAFIGNSHISSIVISASVANIASTAFNNCPSILSYTVANSNEVYDDDNVSGILFKDSVLVRYPAAKTDTSFNLPAYVTEIGEYAFQGCTNLVTVTVPTNNKLTDIDAYAFSGCISLTNMNIPAAVLVGGNAFEYTAGDFGYYTVTFETNGGSSIRSVSVAGGEKIAQPSAPEREGYTFSGWYSDSSFVNPFYFSTNITRHTTVYAKWDILTYSISYNLNGGTNSIANPTSYNIETEDFTLENPSCFGYKFDGWSPSDSTIKKGSTGNKTFTATWWRPTVHFSANGGEITTTEKIVDYNVSTKLPSASSLGLSRSGYYFTGWALTSDATSRMYADEANANFTLDTVLYATWISEEETKWKIIYNLNGGENGYLNPTDYEIKDDTIYFYKDGAQFDVTNKYRLGDPIRVGYEFLGWYTNEDFAGETVTVIGGNGSYGNITLYAKWELVTYPINYVLYGGENDGANPALYSEVDETIILQEPTRSGYVFAGWFDNANFIGEAVTEIASGSTGGLTLYAKWNIIFTITYILNGGENSAENPQTYTIDDVIIFDRPTRTGFAFAGWYRSSDFSGLDVTEIPKNSTGNIILYARWLAELTISATLQEDSDINVIMQKNENTITFTADGGYDSYVWEVDGLVQTESGNTLTVDTESLVKGVYEVTLEAKTEKDYYSATVLVKIQGGN